MVDSLTPWAFVMALVVFAGSLLLCIGLVGFAAYRLALQLIHENRRLAETAQTAAWNRNVPLLTTLPQANEYAPQEMAMRDGIARALQREQPEDLITDS